MSQTSVKLRLMPPLRVEAERIAKRKGTTLDEFVNVAEKLSALRTAELFDQRRASGSVQRALEILRSTGNEQVPREGDER